jgi:hypothetical protein
MTNLRKYASGGKYIKLEELLDKPPLREQIAVVKVEDGKFGERVVLVFDQSGRMLSLNKTSVGNLMRDFGEEDDGWVGQFVEIYAGEVETPSGKADAVLVRAADASPPAAKPAGPVQRKPEPPPKSLSNDMDDEIPF